MSAVDTVADTVKKKQILMGVLYRLIEENEYAAVLRVLHIVILIVMPTLTMTLPLTLMFADGVASLKIKQMVYEWKIYRM